MRIWKYKSRFKTDSVMPLVSTCDRPQFGKMRNKYCLGLCTTSKHANNLIGQFKNNWKACLHFSTVNACQPVFYIQKQINFISIIQTVKLHCLQAKACKY